MQTSAEQQEASPNGPTSTGHAKLAPDDPRIKLRRGRTLKLGPVIALVVALVSILALALVVALESGSAPSEADKNSAEDKPTTQPAIVPDTIRSPPEPSARSVARREPPPPTDRLPVVPLPDEAERRSYGVGYSSDATSPSRQRELRLEEEAKAKNAGILFEAQGATSLEASAPQSRILGSPDTGATSSSTFGLEGDPNAQDRKNAFLDRKAGADYLSATVQRPLSPYEVKAGTVIPAVLITGINSDLPGPVIGQVRENVYDSVSGNHLLIPQGARLIANYDSLVSWGQERVLVCWQRIIFPNGNSIPLECMPAADLQGFAGLADEVDEHWGRLLKGAAIASLLAATTEGVAGNVTSYNPTVAQRWARNGAGEVNQIGQQITRRNLNVQPTITVRPGFSVNLIVTKDMIIPPYSERS